MLEGLFKSVFLMTVIPVMILILIVSEVLFLVFKKNFFKVVSTSTQKYMHDMFTPKRRR